MSHHVTMGLLFSPGGGSAQVVRYLRTALTGTGWSSDLFCGSLGAPDEATNAASCFEGAHVHALDDGPAIAPPDPRHRTVDLDVTSWPEGSPMVAKALPAPV
jgi:hypothetical protein